MDNIKEMWMGLQPRERVMLSAMLGVFSFLAIFIVSVVVSSSFDARAEEIEKYREALYYLEDNQGDYLDNKVEKETLREELRSNDLSVSSYLSQTAADLGFDVAVNPKDAHKAASDDTSGAEEQEFEVTIKTVDRDQLLEYIWAIAQTDAPIFVRRLNMRRSRGRRGADMTETPLTASLTVVSFRLKD